MGVGLTRKGDAMFGRGRSKFFIVLPLLVLSAALGSLLLPSIWGQPQPDQPQPNQPQQNRPDDSAASNASPKTPASQPKLGTRKRGEDWPRFLGAGIDSVSKETGINKDWRTKRPPIVWSRPLGEGYGIGVVSKGRFYQFDRFDDKARLYCLNAETGEQLWQFEYPTTYRDAYQYSGGPRCSPLVDGDNVYIYGVEGILHCVHAITGKPIWKVDVQKQFGVVQNFFGVGSNPVIVGDLVIVMAGGSPEEDQSVRADRLDSVSANGSGIVAFDKRSGEFQYKAGDELASYASLTTAKIGGKDWCLAFARGGLLGLEPKTGKVEFHLPWRDKSLESVNASTPIIIGDQVLISETYGPGTAVLNLTSGKPKVVWADSERVRERKLQTHWNTPVHHDGYVYGSSGRHTANAELRCVRLSDGKVQWSVPDLTRSSLLKVDGHFVCLCEDGTLILIEINHTRFKPVGLLSLKDENGDPMLKYPCWAAPILSHGLLYVRGQDRLVCLELIEAE